MKYWTQTAINLFDRMFAETTGSLPEKEIDEYVKTRLDFAMSSRSPELVCGVLRFADRFHSNPVNLRFSMAIQSMKMKMYEVGYACWDDDGVCFSPDKDEEVVPSGVEAAVVLRDLCESISVLQEKVLKSEIDDGLSALLQTII